ncbi:MAG: hypothetical protein KGZ25_11750, partial [Planctomycetes bacterium]|nr:hypothetical protein [Planctomycetota bacterium]
MSIMKISPIKVPFWAIVILLATTGAVTLTTLTVYHARRSLQRKKSYGDLADLLERGRLLEKLRRESDCRLQVPIGEDKDLLVCVSPSQRRWIVVGCERAKMFFRSYTDGLEFRTRTFDLPTEKKLLQIFCTEARLDFYCGEHILRARAPENWRWLVAPIGKNLSAGEERISVFRSVLKEDGFQRRSFGRNDGWMVEEGSWHTLMRGGGEGNAANAFVLTARHQSGLRPTVRTGWKLCANYTVLVSARPASPQATYRVRVGNKEGSQVSFGWDGDRRVWTLKYFGPDDRTWTYDYDRVVLPPGNWQRFGLRLKSPFEVVPLRGGRELDGKRLPGPVFGRVRIRAKNAPVYFDDFQLRGRDIPAVRATPLHVESRSFAGKKVNEKKDEGFVKWAHDTLSCKRTRFKTSEGTVPANRYRIPLYGDFTYKGPSEGCNRVLLKLADEKGADVRMAFIRQKQRWWYCGEQVGGHLTRGGEVNVPRLRLYCRNGAIYMDGQPKKPLRHLNLDRPIYLTVATPGF